MNAKECLERLRPPLIFGNDSQVRARKVLEEIYELRDVIENCEEDHRSDFRHERLTYRGRRSNEAAMLEYLEEQIEECDCCWKTIPNAHVSELLAAIAVLFDKWWEEK